MKNLSLVEAFLHETVDNKSTLEMSNMLQKILNSKDSTQQSKSVLHKASEQGDLSKVEFLIQLGAQVDAIDEDQATPLHYANSFEVVNCLVNNGANVEAKDIDGQTPLYYADSAIGTTQEISNTEFQTPLKNKTFPLRRQLFFSGVFNSVLDISLPI